MRNQTNKQSRRAEASRSIEQLYWWLRKKNATMCRLHMVVRTSDAQYGVQTCIDGDDDGGVRTCTNDYVGYNENQRGFRSTKAFVENKRSSLRLTKSIKWWLWYHVENQEPIWEQEKARVSYYNSWIKIVYQKRFI